MLDRPGFDRLEALRRHRKMLSQKAARYRSLIQTLDRTLAALGGEAQMKDEDLYKGFEPANQPEYEARLIDRFGDTARDAIEVSKASLKTWSKADWQRSSQEYAEVEAGLGKALAAGVPWDSEAVQALIRRHHAWVAGMWTRRPSREAYAGLGQLYADHPDFRARYEGVHPGLTEYLVGAMQCFGERELA